jgi:pSer/pThr/pTyr-binding forkhead associated (FHA) protein
MSELTLVEQAPNQGAEHPLESGTTIGREGCDIVFSDPDVSRRHAAIQVIRGEVSIEDLGSTNGTYVNGDRIDERRQLGNGDEVKIGSIVLVLRAPSAATRLVDVPSDTPTGATRLRETTSARPAEAPEPAAAAEAPATERMPEPPAPEPAAPEPAAPEPARAAEPPPPAAEPAPEPPAAPGKGRRGDVPLPDFQPSAIRRVVPGPDVTTPFTPETPSRRKGSAATRMGATIMAGLVIAATTAGVVIYYITEPFK